MPPLGLEPSSDLRGIVAEDATAVSSAVSLVQQRDQLWAAMDIESRRKWLDLGLELAGPGRSR